MITKTLVLLFGLIYFVSGQSTYPCPFNRQLSLTSPQLTGSDVYILQNLLVRSGSSNLDLTGIFDQTTASALENYQTLNKLPVTGVLDINTATQILNTNIDDGYKDNGMIPPGFLYKVHIPVYKNRSIETTATLYDSQMNTLLTFTARTHGQNDANGNALNELCSDGSTPTGLMTFDLNSPEDDPADFGPYPVNRAIQGIAGNAFIVISNIRNGILMHTGEWEGWDPSQPMPNSHGCVHAHPEDIDTVWQILTDKLNVVIRNNTFGQLPYTHQPQGILSIELID
eukprot:gene4863-6061_t